jgi:hypothetical protein
MRFLVGTGYDVMVPRRSIARWSGIIWKFFALRVANARSIFEMKEISHRASLRSNWLLVIGSKLAEQD